MQNTKLWSAVLVVALGACASGSVVPLQNVAESDQKAAPSGVTASDYSAHLDLLALGFDNGYFEVRSPAPHHVLSRGKHGSRVVNLALSADGTQLATIDEAGTLAVSHVESGELRVLGERDAYARLATGVPGSVVGLAWAPSGRTLAVCAGSLIRLIEVDDDSGAPRELRLKEDVFALTFSADGSQLVAGGRRLHFLSTATLREARELEVPVDARDARDVRPVSISDLRFNPEGTRLGVLLIGGVAFLDVASQKLDVASLRELNPVGLRFAADGRVAVFGRRAVYVGAAQTAAAQVAAEARATADFVADVEFRKDGSLMLLGGTADEEMAILEWHL